MGLRNGAMPGRPALPNGQIAIFLHQHPKKGVVGKPGGVFQQKLAEVGGPRGVPSPVPPQKTIERGLQQRALERLRLRVMDTTPAQFRQQPRPGQLLEFPRRQVRQMARRHRDRAGFDGQRTDGVVRAVVVACFVDGESLKNTQMVARAPIDHLPDAFGVTETKIVFGANGKNRFKNACQ